MYICNIFCGKTNSQLVCNFFITLTFLIVGLGLSNSFVHPSLNLTSDHQSVSQAVNQTVSQFPPADRFPTKNTLTLVLFSRYVAVL